MLHLFEDGFICLKPKLAHHATKKSIETSDFVGSIIHSCEEKQPSGCVQVVPIFSEFLNQKLGAIWETVKRMNRQK